MSGEPDSSSAQARGLRVRLTLGGKKIIIKMHDNATSRDFLALLPLTLRLSDYAGTEKVSQLPKKLSTKDAPSGFDPSPPATVMEQ